MSNQTSASAPAALGAITSKQVPGHERSRFLPRVFGRHMMRGENLVYDWAARLCPDYVGGLWQFYDLSNSGFYLAPEVPRLAPDSADAPRMSIRVDGNGFDGAMSFDAAGVVISLFAINQLAWQGIEQFTDAYHLLRDFATEHPEARVILQAID